MRYLPLLLLIAAAACSDAYSPPPPPPPLPPPPPGPMLQSMGDFTNPTFLTAPPGDSGRMVVAERPGRVRLFKNDALQPRPFIDLRGQISAADEDGLYSLAFHPQFATNKKVFLFYTNLDGDIRIVRYLAYAALDSVDETTADTILAIPHPTAGYTLPFGNHHGGQLQFGPDGKLYVSVGDGGCCGDPQQNGQRKLILNGKILRIDVDGASGYTIPADNPFVADPTFVPETWAWGFRNPWRFSFDRQTGDLYVGEVGQDQWEEVDVAAAPNAGKGLNYGWSILEGTHCYNAATCNTTGLTPPVLEYQHANGACDVQGGYVYRGTGVPQLAGLYLHADYCTGKVSSFAYTGGAATGARTWPNLTPPSAVGGIVSFGEDAKGELYLMTYVGRLYRIVEGP